MLIHTTHIPSIVFHKKKSRFLANFHVVLAAIEAPIHALVRMDVTMGKDVLARVCLIRIVMVTLEIAMETFVIRLVENLLR